MVQSQIWYGSRSNTVGLKVKNSGTRSKTQQTSKFKYSKGLANNSIYQGSSTAGLLHVTASCCNLCSAFYSVVGNGFFRLSVKLPPGRSKKSKLTYLSSCCVCKPVLNSAISAVPARSRCSYSPHGRTIDQLAISHVPL